jgi:flagellar basal-body rod modification protein FlgD
MTVQSTTATSGAGAAAAAAANSSSSSSSSTVPGNPAAALGQEDFMKLLVAQLKAQDPMNPMQSTDMIAQLSQLSSVQKLQDIDDKLGSLQSNNTSLAGSQSAGLIGHTVTGDTRTLNLRSGINPQGVYQLTSAASSVTVQVSDAAGNVIKTTDLGAQNAGTANFLWDGKSDVGTRLNDGAYTFSVTAKSATGAPVPTSTEVSGRVTEVTYESGAPEVVVGGAHIPLADVTSIAQ